MWRRLSKLLWRLKVAGKRLELRTTPLRPISTMALVGVVAFSIFALMGGIYNLLERPLAMISIGQGRWSFLYPGSVNVQTLNESLVAAVLYVVGLAGFYYLYKSTRLIYRPREAYLNLLIGFSLILLAVFYSLSLLNQKVS
ncbi:MAG: hypothetical protein QXW19_02400 [Candidatus Bathyarchaeia archaeon]